jgi:hypothetical protein
MKIRKMKKFYIGILALLVFITPCIAQNLAINEDGSLPHPGAILDLNSTNKGVLIPRMSTADRLAIAAPRGLLVFDTTTNSFWYCDSVTGTHREWSYLAKGDYWGRRGNMVNDYSYLGTWNNKPLRIRVNGMPSGEIHPTRYNTFWGFGAGNTNSGPWSDSTGNRNTATGSYSLYSNRRGSHNTAIGGYSLYSNTYGDSNTANGYNALYANTTGSGNTAIGSNALSSNISGSHNTAIGSNTALSGNLSNATAIGSGAIANTSNKVRIGNSAVTVIEGQVPFTVPSDGRFKFQVKEDVKGLDFILQLRPVTYRFDVKRFNTQYSQAGTANESSNVQHALQTAYDEAANIRRSGFIAQEVEKAAIASGYNFSGIIQPKTAQEHYSLSYESFVVPLVKAIQELNEKNKKLEQEILEIKQLLQKLK